MLSDSSSQSAVGAPVASVSDFVQWVRKVLESSIPLGWISGEVSNLTRAASGHLYFTIKDERTQIRCTMWRNRAQLLPFRLTEGMQVEVRAQVTVYEARGDLQLSVETIRRAGAGTLYEAFLRLKQKLEQEGLFDSQRKRPLPTLPHILGIVTSPAGAALHDVLTTLLRRAPNVSLILYPSQVQGDGAGPSIAEAIANAGRRGASDKLDALLICRGGGSIEDLWAFNHEAVVRAVAACPVPVISGVGHETDTTLCDLAADVRAATPTAAAELISTTWVELANRLPGLRTGLTQLVERKIGTYQQRADELQRRLIHPAARLQRSRERLLQLHGRLAAAMASDTVRRSLKLGAMETRLTRKRPNLSATGARLDTLAIGLQRGVQRRLGQWQSHLKLLEQQITQLNPSAILQRGYAIVRTVDGKLVRDATTLHPSELLGIQFAKGHSFVRVEDMDGTTEGK